MTVGKELGSKTLEKESNISTLKIDTQHQVDPLFRKVTQKFDDLRMSTLLTSCVNINSNLLIQLDSQMAYTTKRKDEDTKQRQSGLSQEATQTQQINNGHLKRLADFDLLGIAKSTRREKYVGPILEEWKEFIEEEAKKAENEPYKAPHLDEDADVGTRLNREKPVAPIPDAQDHYECTDLIENEPEYQLELQSQDEPEIDPEMNCFVS